MWVKIKEYFKEHSKTEKKKLSEMTLKEKIEYIWEYYKLQIIGAIIIIFVAGSIINGILNPPTPPYAGIAYYEIYLGEDFEAEFEAILTEALVEDPEQLKIYQHFFLSGDDPSAEMMIVQKLMAMLTTNELDVFIAANDVYEQFIFEDMLMPISETGLSVPEELLVYGYTSENPEVAAYGINLKESGVLREFGLRSEALTAGIIVNTARLDNAVSVLRFIVE